ncbi:MAG: ketopantoate reductase C-terminal domain-containing protein, partial [Flavobacteriales bacterium]|nr:ketopantoate reductase C-terminal domain-containing protein [Flavobacteriales bacterium]
MKKHDLDVLFFATKSQHMGGLLKEALKLNSDKLTVVSAQNGIDVEKMLANSFGESRTLRMVINFAGNLAEPNVVKVTFFNPPNHIGSIDDQNTETAHELANALNSTGLNTEVEDSVGIQKKIWNKTILNSALSPLCGVGRLTMAEAMADAHSLELIRETLDECVEVAAAEGIHFSEDFIQRSLGYLRKGGNHFPSLAGDFINNRPTEIDFFNGKIVEYGVKHNIKTSVNLTFVNMVKAMTDKHVASAMPVGMATKSAKIKVKKPKELAQKGDCFLGIDLGSTYTKFSVIDDNHNVLFQTTLQTFNRNKEAMRQVLEAVYTEYPIKYNCATGYGRKHLSEANMAKTEIKCASVGANKYFPGEKNVIDIGGEDIKVIRCDANGNV